MVKAKKVWIVDDDKSIRWMLEKAVTKEGKEVRLFSNADELLVALWTDRPDLIVSDIRMPGMEGLDLLSLLQEKHSNLPVVIMTAYADLEKAVGSFSGGAFEFLPKPFDMAEMMSVINRALRNNIDPDVLSEVSDVPVDLPEIVGSSTPMQKIFRAIGRLSNSSMTVLLTGESGTGKELVARALHRHSDREKKQLIAINAAAIPKDLLESELFGHEKGAFTGADVRRLGRFEQADGGTLFLDEIGDMPLDLQARLLRVLANGEFYRIGGKESIAVNVRLIAATNHNLEERVEKGLFREDLLYRLNVIRLELPPLRNRGTDISYLTGHFLRVIAQDLGVSRKSISQDALGALETFFWPGNVRQLENVCRHLMIMVPSHIIELEDLPKEIRRDSSESNDYSSSDWEVAFEEWVKNYLKEFDGPIINDASAKFESVLIKVALSLANGRRQDAARLIGWGRNTLTRKISELKIRA